MTGRQRRRVRGAGRRGSARAVALAALYGGLVHAGAAELDLTELSLEQLLDVPVVSASKFAQKGSDTAASVTVITRDEIRQYGWRTLDEALRSVRGYYVHGDRDYQYAGVRGFARPQDYNSRVLLLVDGHRTNDAIYDQAYIGTDALLDLDLVDRIEIVRGPGSSIYGGNAMFGVVNLITRKASQYGGLEVAARYSSFDTREGRASYGARLDHGLEVAASVSGMDSAGPDLHFPEFDGAQTHFGNTTGTDYDRNQRAYLRLEKDELAFTAAASHRNKGVPTGDSGSVFGDPINANADYQVFTDLAYSHRVTSTTETSARLSWADYTWRAPLRFGDPPVLDHDSARASWWGADFKVVSAWSPRNTLVAGIEYQSNYRQQQNTYDDDPYHRLFDDLRRSQRAGCFVQDDYQWTDAMKLSLGGRYDKVTGQQGRISPRLGLIYRTAEVTVWRAQYSTAFRAPNAYESYYRFPDSQIANPNLAPETIRTLEAGFEHYIGKKTRLLATAYRYQIDNLINQVVDAETGMLQFQNAPRVSATGVEIEGEHRFGNGARLRASLDLQRPRDQQGRAFTNSPRAVAKVNASTPLPWAALQLGAEAQWLASRTTDSGAVPAYGVVNLTLLRPQQPDGWELSATVRNLFDRKYFDPVAFDPAVPERDRLQQDGRTFRVQATYHF